MDYKQMAVIKERKLAQENERLKTLLYNALVLLNETNSNYTLDDLGIILEDYENRLDNTDEWHTHLTNTLRKFEIIE